MQPAPAAARRAGRAARDRRQPDRARAGEGDEELGDVGGAPQRARADEALAAHRDVDQRELVPAADPHAQRVLADAGRSRRHAPGGDAARPRARRPSSRASPGTTLLVPVESAQSGDVAARLRPRRGACRRRRARRSPRRPARTSPRRRRACPRAVPSSGRSSTSRAGKRASRERRVAVAELAVQRAADAVGGGHHQHAVDPRRAEAGHAAGRPSRPSRRCRTPTRPRPGGGCPARRRGWR